MNIIGMLFRLLGGLCLFLYGMKVMSEGVQRAAGDRMQQALNLMTRNRVVAVLTGFAVTALVQSSSATTVMLVSFVNAGLLTLKQAIGVIMGANIGTTTTAWIVSLIGFKFDIAALALPAFGIGFILRTIKWKKGRSAGAWGEACMGFGFIFLGLEFLNAALPEVRPEQLEFINRVSGFGFLSVLIGVGAGTVVTLVIHSSAATITVVITLAFRGVVGYQMAAAMILGANIGTTIDAIMAAFGARPTAKQTALVHVLFNVAGSVLALVFFRPLLALVDFITPGAAEGAGLAAHLAMFHTVFNAGCTVVFLPFVSQFASLVSYIIKEDKKAEALPEHYRFEYRSGAMHDAPELSILRAEKEIRDMAGIVSDMYERIGDTLGMLRDSGNPAELVDALTSGMCAKEEYADEMRETLSHYLIECTRRRISFRSEQRVARLLRIVADLENMTDDCYGVSLLLERSVKKDQIFKNKEMQALLPYISLVGDFLEFVQARLGKTLTPEEVEMAKVNELSINMARNKLRKLGRKRIEKGQNVKTELLFIDFVRRLEQLGDYCYSISSALTEPEE
jgi:phosphate:Na+ symporter